MSDRLMVSWLLEIFATASMETRSMLLLSVSAFCFPFGVKTALTHAFEKDLARARAIISFVLSR